MDALSIAILAALIGAASSVTVTLATLHWTGGLERQRYEKEWVYSRSADRRAVYGQFLADAYVWRDACADLEGEPSKEDWDRYWAARLPVIRSAQELSLVAPAGVIESADEALEELLDISWDYDVNGEDFLQAVLWVKIEVIDRELDKVRDAARAEFGEAALPPTVGGKGGGRTTKRQDSAVVARV